MFALHRLGLIVPRSGCPPGYTANKIKVSGPSLKCKGAFVVRCEWTGYNPRKVSENVCAVLRLR
eukprot:SAG31_NODE_8743_length_1395_cov_8.237617_2_plen_64_part_00